MAGVKTVGVVLGLVVVGGVVATAGRRALDPLEYAGFGEGFDEPDPSDEPLWVELPLERSGVAAGV